MVRGAVPLHDGAPQAARAGRGAPGGAEPHRPHDKVDRARGEQDAEGADDGAEPDEPRDLRRSAQRPLSPLTSTLTPKASKPTIAPST